jgi:hypothetical protein
MNHRGTKGIEIKKLFTTEPVLSAAEGTGSVVKFFRVKFSVVNNKQIIPATKRRQSAPLRKPK